MAKRIILYLTAKERLLLERQGADVLSRCTLHDEDHVIDDGPEHRRLRAELFEPSHPVLRGVALALARPGSTESEIHAMLAGADLSGVTMKDMLEVTFLLGPVGMTSLLFEMLSADGAAANLDLVAELSELRHHMLFAQDASSSSSV